MFRASARALTATVRSDPLTRAQIDFFSGHVLPNEASDSSPPLERSDAAKSGLTMRGDVALPEELKQAVLGAINVLQDKSLLRTRALELYEYLRNSMTEKGLETTKAPHYDDLTSLAFLTGVMPAMYAATLNVLKMAKSKLGPEWSPDKVIDYGSGTGSSAWAANQVWPETQLRYVGIESSQSMATLSNALFQALNPAEDEDVPDMGSITTAKSHLLPIPLPEMSQAKLQLLPKQNASTIALSSFALSNIATLKKRREVVEAMWNSGAPVIVIVERGTPAGSKLVLDARDQLLALGRRPESTGSHVIAPCPHDGACPLKHSPYSHCHFNQRLQMPSFLRQTKATTRGEDTSKFSYVIIKREPRPEQPAVAELAAEQGGTALSDPKRTDLSAIGLESSHLRTWPRIIAPPRKASRHVIFEVCAPNERIERHTIPKSQGRQAYYDARKAAWGDAFPHPPKNGPQVSRAMMLQMQEESSGGGDAIDGTKAAKRRTVSNNNRPKRKTWRQELVDMDPSSEFQVLKMRKPANSEE